MSANEELTLPKAFTVIGRLMRDPPDLIDRLLGCLPESIASAEVGNDVMTGRLRYEYGQPFTDIFGSRVFGTHQLNELWQLYVAVRTANRFLDEDQLIEYMKRLEDSGKHGDALLEMRPVCRLSNSVDARYEVGGRSGKRIDWDVRNGIVHIRFDVKNRVKGAIAHFKDIAAELAKGNSEPSVPKTDPEAFFRNTEEKFHCNLNPLVLQGIWAHVHIKENRNTLESYFRTSVDHLRIDFLIIAGWTNECFILARSKCQKEYLKKFFMLVESDNFVF